MSKTKKIIDVALTHNKKNKSVLIQLPKKKLSPELRKKLHKMTHAKIKLEDLY